MPFHRREVILGAGRRFDPTRIAGCVLWLAADKLALADGASVAAWTDASGNGKNPTTQNALVYKTSILNGNPIVRFDGSTSYLVTPTLANAPITVIMAFKLRSTDASARSLFDHSNSNAGRFYTPNASVFRLYAGSAEVCETTPNNILAPTIACAIFDGASSSLALNNGIALGGNPGTQPTGNQGHVIGRFGTGGASSYVFLDLAEHVVYNRHLTAAEVTTVTRALGTKFGITVS